MSRLALLIVLGILILEASHALADGDPLAQPTNSEAVAKLKEGNRLFQLADYDGAVAAYKAGYLLEASPLFQYNLGQAYRLSDKFAEAIHHYKAFIREANPTGELRLYVEDFVKVLTAKRERADAERAKAEKKEAEERERARRAAANTPTTTTTAAPRDGERWYQDGVGWGVVATGLVGAGVGVGLLLNGASLRDDAENEPDQLKAKDLRESADGRQLIGGIVGGVGGALLVAGIIKLAIAPISPEGVEVSSYIDSDSVVVGFSSRF